jgi:hypothetical protein
MLLMRANSLRGQVGGGWALKSRLCWALLNDDFLEINRNCNIRVYKGWGGGGGRFEQSEAQLSQDLLPHVLSSLRTFTKCLEYAKNLLM